MADEPIATMQKAFSFNMDPHKYGTIAEIGAGQEVSRFFFRAGGAAGTIAKTISAYDMDFSDAIYGREADKRYVTENRVKKMLDKDTNYFSPDTPEAMRRWWHQTERALDSTDLDRALLRGVRRYTTIDTASTRASSAERAMPLRTVGMWNASSRAIASALFC